MEWQLAIRLKFASRNCWPTAAITSVSKPLIQSRRARSTLPATDGSANYVLKTDAAGNLSFVSAVSSVQDSITDAVTTMAPSENAVFDALALKLNTAGGTLSGALDMSSQKITNLATPTNPSDAATMAYADGVIAPYLYKNGSTPLTAAWAVGGFNITGVGAFASTSITASTLTTSAQAALTVAPYNTAAGNTGEVRYGELLANGTNYVGFKAPDALAADKIWTLPAADGSANNVLTMVPVSSVGLRLRPRPFRTASPMPSPHSRPRKTPFMMRSLLSKFLLPAEPCQAPLIWERPIKSPILQLLPTRLMLRT